MARATRVVTYYALPADAAAGASDRLAQLSRAPAAFARKRRLVGIEPFVGGRRGPARPQLPAALRARADAHAEALAPALRELLLSNPTASLRDLAALLEQLELPTPRRGCWGPSAVRNALHRAGIAAPAWRGL